MNALYLSLQPEVATLIKESGQAIVFTRRSVGGNVVLGTVGGAVLATTTLMGAVVPASGGTLEAFDVRFMDGVNADTNVRFALVATLQPDGSPPAFQPGPGDEAFFENRNWTVMGNTPVNVDGETPLVFSIGFRGL